MRKSKPAVETIQTTAGLRYVHGRKIGREFQQSPRPRYFKTKAAAMRAAIKSYE